MGHAEVISLDEVRATHHLSQWRQRLHERFDRWLDTLETHLDDTPMNLPDLSDIGSGYWHNNNYRMLPFLLAEFWLKQNHNQNGCNNSNCCSKLCTGDEL